MKIKLLGGEEIDTDSLPDTHALAIERVHELSELLRDYGLPYFLFVNLPNNNAYANRYVDKSQTEKYVQNLHGSLMALTNGTVGLAIHRPPPPTTEQPNDSV
jgi:hypothetical protein